jgi:hypothetical protein
MIRTFSRSPDLTAQNSAEQFAEELRQDGKEVDCYQATTPQGEPLNEWLVVW